MILLLAAHFATAVSEPCPIERARYRMRAESNVTAEFHPTKRNGDWPSGLSLAIHVSQTDRTYWWLPWNGGTDDMRHVRLTWNPAQEDGPPGDLKPGIDQDFWTADADYTFLDAVPRAGDRAPAHLLMPMLGRTLYFGTVQTHRADNVPRSFFDLVSCDAVNDRVDVVLPPVA